MRRFKMFLMVFASLLILIGLILVGCQLFGGKDSPAPTAPDQGAAAQRSTYYALNGSEGTMKVFVKEGGTSLVSVNVIPGSYSLWYQVIRWDNKPHAYAVDFRALAEATLCLGLLPGDILKQAVIAAATFSGAPIHRDGPVELYAFPGGWTGWTGAAAHAGTKRAAATPPPGTRLYPRPQVPVMPNRCSGPGATLPVGPTTTSVPPTSTTTSVPTTTTTSSSTTTSATPTTSTSSSTSSSTTTSSTTTTTQQPPCPQTPVLVSPDGFTDPNTVWYWGPVGWSCSDVCDDLVGLGYSDHTRDWAGSGAADDTGCIALGLATDRGFVEAHDCTLTPGAVGCYTETLGVGVWRCNAPPTTAEAAPDPQGGCRYCACYD